MEVKTQNLSTPAAQELSADPNLIKVVISYPKDWKGEKHYADGDEAWLSRESADSLIAAGVAKEKKRSADEKVPADNDAKLGEKKVTGTNVVKGDDELTKIVAKEAKK